MVSAPVEVNRGSKPCRPRSAIVSSIPGQSATITRRGYRTALLPPTGPGIGLIPQGSRRQGEQASHEWCDPHGRGCVMIQRVRPGFDLIGLVPRRGLFERVGDARVTVVSAPAGSGKTVLLQSWIDAAGLAGRTAWVPVHRPAHDARRFWLTVADALHGTTAGSGLVQAVSAGPDLDEWALVERLLEDLAPLAERLWLVIDDVHDLDTAESLRQLELLMLRAPAALRFVLATRHEVPLGLHRLRLQGQLAEVRGPDLRFSLAETRELFAGAGIELPDAALAALHERTEGWAAGVRLAALSLAGHPDPVRFAAEFSGSERTVAEYLVAEVLERQSPQVRRMLLRTSVLERVSGELADLLTGGSGGERILHELERANAFVSSLDPARSWFRYHQMFADLLQLELRRTAPGEIAGLHRIAAGWLAAHGFPVEAVRHAQAAQDWPTAARLLADHWPSLLMDGATNIIHQLLTDFPAAVLASDGELALMAAADDLRQAPAKARDYYLTLAERAAARVPPERRAHAQLVVLIIRLLAARHGWNLLEATEAARQLKTAEILDGSLLGLRPDLRALAVMSVGATEYWTAHFEDAVHHLQLGVELARRAGRPYLEFTSLAYQASSTWFCSFASAVELGEQAMELARRHGWADEPTAGLACMVLALVRVWRGQSAEAESWLLQAERTLRSEALPATGMSIRFVRGDLELARGCNAEALAAYQSAERFANRLATPSPLVTAAHSFQMHALIRLGENDRAAAAFAALDAHERDSAEVRLSLAALQLARHEPRDAAATVAPVLDGSVPLVWQGMRAQGYLLAAIAHEALGETEAAEVAVECALDVAEPEGALLWFLLHPVPEVLERLLRQHTGHAALIARIQSLLAGSGSDRDGPRLPSEALSDSEIRVLRYLPTHLSAPEIARELSVSPNTVKTHLRNLYTKLGVHRRTEAVGHARALGLLAPIHRR
ncbi:LuxR C-terminal-related transcriptional regulator [Nocardia sp. NPDC051570]|uniref:LuxR C-terminal-related transcriptional regulator n=1 Tax=Nocardia sp. NPDC051570 TaxID=3364324 RepID=UPI00378B7BE3